MLQQLNIVLIIGSAPDSIISREWRKDSFSNVVAINNAWRVREDWDYLIYPEDFPLENRPKKTSSGQVMITAQEFVPAQNSFGGFVYAGGTMAFTTAYWVLAHLRPQVIAFIGCDMVYPSTGVPTHFYGTGNADPLRDDLTLQSLEAKSARLFYLAYQNNCLCLNLSTKDESRLVFPRISIDKLEAFKREHYADALDNTRQLFHAEAIGHAVKREHELSYYFDSGRYWDHLDAICPDACLKLDNLWLKGLKLDQLNSKTIAQV